MDVLELKNGDCSQWDEYVYGSANSTVFHLSGWKNVMEKTFGLQSHFLYAINGKQILGVLPLFHVSGIFGGHYLTSTPGGMCCENSEAASALVEQGKRLVKQRGAKYMILRDSYTKWDLPELVTNDNHCTFKVQLVCDPDQMWKKIDRRIRQHTKHAIEANMTAEIGPENLDKFYSLYSSVMREMGTPTFGGQFFRNVFQQFPQHFTTILVRSNDLLMGSIVAAFFNGTIYNIWWGMLPKYYEQRSCHSLYWETLKYGCENGFNWVDLGRSELNSGTYTFKTRWPATQHTLFNQSYLNGSGQAPVIGHQRAANLDYRLFTRVWSRLPSPFIEILGPQLRKQMPFG